MRKLLIVIGVIVAILVVATVALPSLIDVNKYRGEVQAQVQQRLNRPVQLGEMSLAVFPVRVKVKDVTIGDDPSFHNNLPFAQVAELDLSVKLFPLLRKEIQIKSLEMKRAKIELIGNAQGVWNFSTMGNGRTGSTAVAPSTPAEQKAFSLGELEIRDSQIAITDYQKHEPRAVYDHIDVTLKDYVPGQTFSIYAAAHLPGGGAQMLRLTAEAGPINDTDFTATPFNGTVKLDQVSLSGAQKFLNTASLQQTDAVISGSTKLVNSNGKVTADGNLKFDNAVIHGVEAGYPISAEFDVTNDLTNDVIQIRKGSLKLGATPLAVNGTVNTRPNPAVVDVNVSASNASIQEVARLAAAFGVAFSPNTKIAGQLTLSVHAQGPTEHLALSGNVNGRNLEVTGNGIPQPVRVPAIDLTMNPQQIQSNNFTVTSGATTLAAQMTVTQYTSNAPNVDATLKTVNAKLNELLGIAKAYGASVVEGMSGNGNISLDVHATGPVKNPDAMSFSGSGALQNASLKTPTLTQPVNIRNANLQFTQNSVNLTNLAASLGSSNVTGNVSVANLQAPRLTFAITADKVNVDELQKITGGTAPAAKKKAEAAWSLFPAANAAPVPAAKPGLLASATGTGTISMGTILYQQLQLTSVHSNVTLDHGVIQLNPLTAQIAGGQETGSVTMDTRQPVTTFAVNAKLTGVDANRLLSSISSVKDTVYGTLTANANITFSTPPSGDVVQTLNGSTVLNLANGKITKIDLVNELSKIGKFGGGTPKGYTAISSMSGTFNLRNGVAQTTDLKAALDVGTMAANGSANLVNQGLNMHVTAVLNKGFSQSVGGTGVGGYLNTALANKNGELVLPVIITGTMSRPMVAPDVQQIAQMKLKNLLPTAGGLLNGNGNLGGALGGLLGQQQPAKPGQPQQKQNSLGGALNQLLGPKKKP